MFDLSPNNNRGLSRQDDVLDFYNMVDSFFNNGTSPFRGMQNSNFRVDLRETDKEYLIDAELAGFKKEDIKLDFDNGKLYISVSRQNEMNNEKGNYIHRERSYSSMQRGVYLKNVTGEGIKAKFENGVLEVTVPKSQTPERNTRIEIQ